MERTPDPKQRSSRRCRLAREFGGLHGLGQIVDERSDARRYRRVAIVDGVDGLPHVLRLTREQLHEAAFATVAACHEVRQADDACALQRQLPQRFAARRRDGGFDPVKLVVEPRKRPDVERLGVA